ncbi:hypothetical protein FO519_007683 [Halicephalobus sp. NKZ332]|nr:hypothetical protein FO519_007683 [Halicephalobus sp. NKZ332]
MHVTCLLVAGLVVGIYTGQVYYGFCSRTTEYFYLGEIFAPWFGDENGKVETIGIMGTFDKYLYVYIAHSSFNIIGCYSIIIKCSCDIYKYLNYIKRTTHVDHNIIEVQHQLAMTLIIQAVIPLITFCIPANLIFITLIFQIKMPEYVLGILGLMLTYIPLGNALSMFFFVKIYRNFGIQLLRKAMKKVPFICHESSVEPNNTTAFANSSTMNFLSVSTSHV